jgi:hypothetical protein
MGGVHVAGYRQGHGSAANRAAVSGLVVTSKPGIDAGLLCRLKRVELSQGLPGWVVRKLHTMVFPSAAIQGKMQACGVFGLMMV